MNRDEFMELVYETFADEPDNVLANGIIEAADAYAEHEKAQLSCEGTTEGTTSDLISKKETVEHLRRMFEATVPNTDYDEGFIDGVEFGISTVSTMPTIQPEPQEGKWVYGEDSTADCVDGYRCSRCGFFVPWDYNHKLINYINDYAYCPKCGAKMKGARSK